MSDQIVSKKGEVLQFSQDRRRTPVKQFISGQGGDVIALAARRERVERDPPQYFREQARRHVEILKKNYTMIAYLLEEVIADLLHREVLDKVQVGSLVGYIHERLTTHKFETALEDEYERAKSIYSTYKTEDLLDEIRAADDRLASFRRYFVIATDKGGTANHFTRPGEERLQFYQSEKWRYGYEPVLVLVFLAVEPQIVAKGQSPRQSGN